MKTLDYFEYKISASYLSALINGDFSGLDDNEELQFTEWLYSQDRRIVHWDVIDHGDNFARCEVSNLFADCAVIRGYFWE
jgi:hypothetical protein